MSNSVHTIYSKMHGNLSPGAGLPYISFGNIAKRPPLISSPDVMFQFKQDPSETQEDRKKKTLLTIQHLKGMLSSMIDVTKHLQSEQVS